MPPETERLTNSGGSRTKIRQGLNEHLAGRRSGERNCEIEGETKEWTGGKEKQR